MVPRVVRSTIPSQRLQGSGVGGGGGEELNIEWDLVLRVERLSIPSQRLRGGRDEAVHIE